MLDNIAMYEGIRVLVDTSSAQTITVQAKQLMCNQRRRQVNSAVKWWVLQCKMDVGRSFPAPFMPFNSKVQPVTDGSI